MPFVPVVPGVLQILEPSVDCHETLHPHPSTCCQISNLQTTVSWARVISRNNGASRVDWKDFSRCVSQLAALQLTRSQQIKTQENDLVQFRYIVRRGSNVSTFERNVN